jgi:hypothetical protein
MANFFGCPCTPDAIWIPAPTGLSPPPSQTSTPSSPSLPPLEDPWYCVGLFEDDYCNQNAAGCTSMYGMGVRNMNSGVVTTTSLTGVSSYATQDLCSTTINGAEILCQGDITAQCSGYGIALYDSRSCRTYCPSAGDTPFCWDSFDGYSSSSQSASLICDRALS